jgi:predicted transcriptional regulator
MRGTLAAMELHLTPETDAKLNELALRTHPGTDELLEEAVEHLAVQRGETVPDEDVRAWLEGRERS